MGKCIALVTLSVWIAWWPLWGQSKNEPSNQPKPAKTQATKSQTDQRGTKDSPIVVDILDRPQGKSDTANAEKENRDEKFNERLTTWSAAAAALFTLLLVIIG